MISNEMISHIEAYKSHGQIIDAAEYVLRTFGLEDANLQGFEYREEVKDNYLVITTEGEFGELQKIRLPLNFFDYNLALAVNLLAHEMIHVRQKTREPYVLDKNEREWQAYTENLFHKEFPQVPDAPLFNQKQFAQNALMYYNRMEKDGELQLKYAVEKSKVEARLDEILIARGEKEDNHNI